MTHDPLETTIRSKIVKHINSLPFASAHVRHQAGYAKKGDPDVYGSYCRLHIEIEVKRPGKNPTELQKLRLAHWCNVGAMVAVLRSKEGAIQFIEKIDELLASGIDFRESTQEIFDDQPEIKKKKRVVNWN